MNLDEMISIWNARLPCDVDHPRRYDDRHIATHVSEPQEVVTARVGVML